MYFIYSTCIVPITCSAFMDITLKSEEVMSCAGQVDGQISRAVCAVICSREKDVMVMLGRCKRHRYVEVEEWRSSFTAGRVKRK